MNVHTPDEIAAEAVAAVGRMASENATLRKDLGEARLEIARLSKVIDRLIAAPLPVMAAHGVALRQRAEDDADDDIDADEDEEETNATPQQPAAAALPPPLMPEPSAKRAATRPRKPAAAPPPAKPSALTPALGAIERNGITLVREPDEESIGHKGKWMDLTASQAALAEVLLRASPEPVARNFIRDRIWPGSKPASWEVLLTQRASALRDAVKGVDLAVVTVPGVGIALQEAA